MDNDKEISNAFSEENPPDISQGPAEKPEESEIVTIIKGIIGAILGTIPSMILWIVLGKVGIVASLCGFFMILGELYACEFMTKKSGQMNKETALVICVIVMAAAIYLCERVIWSWELSDMLNQYEATFSGCFMNFWQLLEDLDIEYDFKASLIQSYIFAAIGGIVGAGRLLKSNRE